MADAFISTIVERLKDFRGIEAIVLGGSRGRGTHRPDSDYDIGIYYGTPHDFDIAALNRIATELDDEHREDLCTPISGWGPWVVGGGWLVIGGEHVNFIYRELPRVRRVIDECLAGKVTVNYQAGHPFGFISSMYVGEVATCQSLWDAEGIIAELKSMTRPYPTALQRAIFNSLSWEPGFCVAIASNVAQHGDVYYLSGLLFRAVSCMTQTLFAINEQWWLNEKGAVALVSSFARVPSNYAKRVNEMFAAVASNPNQAVDILAELDREVSVLRDESLLP